MLGPSRRVVETVPEDLVAGTHRRQLSPTRREFSFPAKRCGGQGGLGKLALGENSVWRAGCFRSTHACGGKTRSSGAGW
jgi:hypothetical protein